MMPWFDKRRQRIKYGKSAEVGGEIDHRHGHHGHGDDSPTTNTDIIWEHWHRRRQHQHDGMNHNQQQQQQQRSISGLRATTPTPPPPAAAASMELLRPSLVNNFQAASLRESFQRRLSSLSSPAADNPIPTTSLNNNNNNCRDIDDNDDYERGGGVMEWPSPVSSLGSRTSLVIAKHSSSTSSTSGNDFLPGAATTAAAAAGTGSRQRVRCLGGGGSSAPPSSGSPVGGGEGRSMHSPPSVMIDRSFMRRSPQQQHSNERKDMSNYSSSSNHRMDQHVVSSSDTSSPRQQHHQQEQILLPHEEKKGEGRSLPSSSHRGSPSEQPCNSSADIHDNNEEEDDEDGSSSVSSLDSLASPVSRVLKNSLSSFTKHHQPPSSSSKTTATTTAATTTATPSSLDAKASMVEINTDKHVLEHPLTATTTNNNNSSSSIHTNTTSLRNHHRRISSFSNHKRQSSSDKSDDKSLGIDDLGTAATAGGTVRDSFRASGLGNVALHLEYSTKSMNTYYSSDGIDTLHPCDTTEKGREDFDFAWNAYAKAVKFGHFDFFGDDLTSSDNNRAVATSMEGDDDQVLAAKAYMGLGFVRQCKGELGSALDAYQTSLDLWEDVLGETKSDPASPVAATNPVLPSILCTIGSVLVEMERLLEASDYFTKALQLFKRGINNSNNNNSSAVPAAAAAVGGVGRMNILSTEGMLFSMLGEANMALDCFQKAIDGFQSGSSSQSMSLKLATVMFEMGSLHSVLEVYDKSANCFDLALGIRKVLLGDSFLVARTHYSLGVTIASQELKTNSTASSSESHLKEALRICEKEFESEHIQSAFIVRALGVLNESRGHSLSASVWFAKELTLRKMLLGEDHESVASVCADLGTCYYNSGKYELAISRFADCLRIRLLRSNTDRSLEVAEALYKIASCHDRLCNYDKALEIFHKVKQIRESHPNVESGSVIHPMLRIGNIHLCQGEIEKALECFSEVLGIGYTNDSVNAVEVANAFYGRGCAQFCDYHLTDAMKSFSESLNWKLAALGENDPGLACIFYQMAHVYLEQSEPVEAITCFEEFVRLQKLDKQRNLQDNAEICYAEGIVAKLNGRLDSALSFYFQALTMFETLFGDNHEKVASILFDIGCIYSTISDYASALSNFQKCLLRRRRLLGDHVDVANTLYEIATVHYNIDNTDLAIDCLTESDRIWKVKLTSSEKLSTVLLPSANLWKSLQAYEAAEKNFEQALECAIDLHGKDHELVASIFLRFGEFLHEINQIQQATFCFDEAIRVRTLIFGENSPNVAQVEYSKGVALLFHGDFVDASSCLNRALTIRQETLGHQHAEVGDTLNTIGFLHLRMGNFSGDEALDPLMRSLEIRRAIGNKSKIVTTLQNMASVYKRRKEFDSYLEMHVEILTVRQAQFGCNDARVADAWVHVGNILVSLGRLEEATVSYEEALRVQTHLHGPNHTSVARILFKFGSLYSKQNKFTEAKDMLEEYTRIRATEVDDPDGEMAKALTMLGDLQKEAGEKSKAQINWTSAMNIYQQLNYPEDHPKLFKLRERQKTISFVDSSWNSIDLSWRSVGDFATRQDSGLG